ncbi:unnamed protein product [Oppiella nova]|uniref:Ima1 N-terminal domain-containing protein n=1 Tax=Oppiella nova TaxID=334625 RepID=A0A7R9MH18_9ACAR|nr:unnamed protein product [Oppiella nova]CAG2176260.1 unnamed protein product [Oppiella nova]
MPGIVPDGNYNKAITGQSCDPMSRNNLRFCRPIPDCYANCGQLCSECNVNQEIKIKLLSEFMPFNETKYKEELEEYKRHLESEYKLCANCETTVKNILLKPINCLKDIIKGITKRHVRVSQDSVDSVFVSQNDRRLKKWLPFIATTQSFEKAINNGLKGVPNRVQVKNPKEVNIKSKDTSADHQSIGEQIKSLSIGDEINASSLKVNAIQRHPMRNELLPKADDLSANSALIYGNSLSKNIINPAKFHYESIAQTSWVSPFKPNQSPSKSPRKECLNYSPYLHNSQQYLRSSHWINNDMSGLVTPPPSVAPSDTSDFAFANRFSLLNKTNCSSTHVLDYKSRDFNASNESILRNTIISQQFIRRESIGRSSKDTDSDLSQCITKKESIILELLFVIPDTKPKRHSFDTCLTVFVQHFAVI